MDIKELYVYCEGENTEPYYLRDINKYNKMIGTYAKNKK